MNKDEIIKKIKENKTPVFIVSVILVVFSALLSRNHDRQKASLRPLLPMSLTMRHLP